MVIIKIPVTQDIITRAEAMSNDMGALRNSITHGDGNIAGFIGEIIFCDFIKGEHSNTYDYDVVKDGEKWDVKTKRCTSPPKSFYECSVANFNTSQACDNYCFMRIQQNDGRWGDAYLLGWMPRVVYYDAAKFLKKGDIDPSNNFRVKADCWNLPISKLRRFYVDESLKVLDIQR